MTNMKSYKVSLWTTKNSEQSPDNVIFVDSDVYDRRIIRDLAFQQLKERPAQYMFDIEEVHNLDELSVIQISGSDKADEGRWFYNKDGEYYVALFIHSKGKYMLCNTLGNSGTVGYIEPEYCTVLQTFKG